MLKFARTRFKRGATDAEREKLKQELFTFKKVRPLLFCCAREDSERGPRLGRPAGLHTAARSCFRIKERVPPESNPGTPPSLADHCCSAGRTRKLFLSSPHTSTAKHLVCWLLGKHGAEIFLPVMYDHTFWPRYMAQWCLCVCQCCSVASVLCSSCTARPTPAPPNSCQRVGALQTRVRPDQFITTRQMPLGSIDNTMADPNPCPPAHTVVMLAPPVYVTHISTKQGCFGAGQAGFLLCAFLYKQVEPQWPQPRMLVVNMASSKLLSAL
uniref:Uncharacterized protein n=1 Tax=Branchiostoma floridae TaxID=7739 RepID=C3Z7S4_BRAFL|eukprot:XP_002595417.1 hypothetical protein BRAFLDRAFT_69248 [Branchiostoma floridae]